MTFQKGRDGPEHQGLSDPPFPGQEKQPGAGRTPEEKADASRSPIESSWFPGYCILAPAHRHKLLFPIDGEDLLVRFRGDKLRRQIAFFRRENHHQPVFLE